jgi:hypothetical protein
MITLKFEDPSFIDINLVVFEIIYGIRYFLKYFLFKNILKYFLFVDTLK